MTLDIYLFNLYLKDLALNLKIYSHTIPMQR